MRGDELSGMQRPPVVICVLSVLLASCARSAVPSSPAAPSGFSALRSGSPTIRFTHVFSFNGTDGKEPYASFIYANGALFGTTYGGGTSDDGTAFEMTPATRKQTVLHSFNGGMDGSLPQASLVDVQGTLYGTTVNGGGSGDEGTVFKINRAGAERILHRFGTGSDGANPYASLTDARGTLFGTTAGGGAYSAGTIFKITPSGSETRVYNFGAVPALGMTPVARLLDVNGTMYGTTAYGGSSYRGKYCYPFGCGTVFKYSTPGEITVLHDFAGGSDGSMPTAALVNVGGTFYGTTLEGGPANHGTVFAITSSGKERVLYAFKGGTDGAAPVGVTNVNGTLYGTTSAGGSSSDGTIFSVTQTGDERIVYTFKGDLDGAVPRAGLNDVNGTLYGTTSRGGATGAGTVFSITP